MADGVANEDLLDLIATTHANYPFAPGFDWAQEFHEYDALNTLITKDKLSLRSGERIKHKIALTESGAAKWVDLYETTDPAVADVMSTIEVPWRYAQVDYSIERHEMLENMEPERIVELVRVRRQDAMRDMAGVLQQRLWLAPATNASTDKTPFGIPYWITPIVASQVTSQAATTNGDFQGYLPVAEDDTDFAACGGITSTSTSNARWANWNDAWGQSDGTITEADLTRLRRMFRHQKWGSPIIVDDLNMAMRDLRMYTNETVLNSMEEIAHNQNDDLGPDLAKYAEATSFKRHPIRWEEQLDSDTTNPFYMINFRVLKPVCLKGDYFREEKPMNSRRQHNVFTTFVDLTINTLCRNRHRVGGIISYVAAA